VKDFGTAAQIVLLAPPILLAVTVHECSHGWMADRLGDPTARLAGRLTLNPIKHLDVVGTLVFLLTRMIGWAKPVPVNPYNLRNPRRDMLWISLAGPSANLITAVLSALVYRLAAAQVVFGGPPGVWFWLPLLYMAQFSVMVNVGLAFFNLLPVHPLDGSKILAGLLSPGAAAKYEQLAPYGFIILLLLIFSNVLDYILFPALWWMITLLLGG